MADRFLPSQRELRRQPPPDVRHKVRPQRDVRSSAILLIGGVQRCVRVGASKLKLAHGKRSQLALAKTGQYQRLVNQCSLAAEPLQLLARSRLDFGQQFAFVLPATDGPGVQQRATACCIS